MLFITARPKFLSIDAMNDKIKNTWMSYTCTSVPSIVYTTRLINLGDDRTVFVSEHSSECNASDTWKRDA